MKRLVAVLLLATLGACSSGGADTVVQPANLPQAGKPLPEEGIVCPADVRLCPDGSTVIRDPAKACAFKPCPGDTQ